MALVRRIDLVRPIGCARLSFHGGSLLAGFRPGFVTGRIARPVRRRRSQISTVSRTSPQIPTATIPDAPDDAPLELYPTHRATTGIRRGPRRYVKRKNCLTEVMSRERTRTFNPQIKSRLSPIKKSKHL